VFIDTSRLVCNRRSYTVVDPRTLIRDHHGEYRHTYLLPENVAPCSPVGRRAISPTGIHVRWFPADSSTPDGSFQHRYR